MIKKSMTNSGRGPVSLSNPPVYKNMWLSARRMIIVLMVIGLTFSFLACAQKQAGVYQNPGAVPSQAGKIAVLKFSGIESSTSGQEAANLVALAFMQKGYSVVDAGNVLAPADQERLYKDVITPEIKTKFKNNGVNAIVLGTIHDYSCSYFASRFLALFSIESYSKYCRVDISAKMIKLDSGEIVWGTSRTGESGGDDINAGMVLRSTIGDLEGDIPAHATQPSQK